MAELQLFFPNLAHNHLVRIITIELGLGVMKFGRTSVTFDQVVFSEGRCVASAQATTVLIDEVTRRPTPLTEEILRNFERWKLRTAASA